jgi:hypothetical protein
VKGAQVSGPGGSAFEGPTWYDVSQAVTAVEQEFACRIQLHLSPPMATGPSMVWSPWQVLCLVSYRGSPDRLGPSQAAAWGKGGHWKTAPQACYQAVMKLHTYLTERQAEAERQAGF